MKLILAIVQDADADRLNQALVDRGYGVTKLASTGGFLRRGNTTFLIGVDDDRAAVVISLIRHLCGRREALAPPSATTGQTLAQPSAATTVGGATVFVLNVEQAAHY